MALIDTIKFVEIIRADRTSFTATPSDVVTGKTYIGTTRKLESGTLPLLAQRANITLVAGESYTVEYGKNPKAYTVIAQGLSQQTPATATANRILTPYTAWVNGTRITGSMRDNGGINKNLSSGETYVIPEGYHDGSGQITAPSVSSTTTGDATAQDIRLNKVAWVNGNRIVGTMPDRFAVSVILNAGETYTVPEGYHNGVGTVKAASLAEQTQGTASAPYIVDGYTAWVNGTKVTGSMLNVEPQDIELPMNGTYIIPRGYHSGLGQVTQSIPTVTDQLIIAPSFETQTIETSGKFMANNITVQAINALNYQRVSNTVVNNSSINVTGSNRTFTFKVSVDNWHDNATLNVYNVQIRNSSSNIILSGNMSIDWAGNDTSEDLALYNGNLKVTLGLESGTNAHTFTITAGSGFTNGTYNVTIKEIFHARQYGDDHDKDTASVAQMIATSTKSAIPGVTNLSVYDNMITKRVYKTGTNVDIPKSTDDLSDWNEVPDNNLVEANNGDDIVVADINENNNPLYYAKVTAQVEDVPKELPLFNIKSEEGDIEYSTFVTVPEIDNDDIYVYKVDDRIISVEYEGKCTSYLGWTKLPENRRIENVRNGQFITIVRCNKDDRLATSIGYILATIKLPELD